MLITIVIGPSTADIPLQLTSLCKKRAEKKGPVAVSGSCPLHSSSVAAERVLQNWLRFRLYIFPLRSPGVGDVAAKAPKSERIAFKVVGLYLDISGCVIIRQVCRKRPDPIRESVRAAGC